MRRWIATGLLAAMIAGVIPGVALAGSGGRKNTAIGLTAGAVYTWINGGTKSAGRRNTAIALTAASVVAWHKHKQAKRAERRRAQAARSYAYRSQPVSYTRGYRGTYAQPVSGGRSNGHTAADHSSGEYCQPSYRAGYRAGYNAAAGSVS